jgi:hypothetical protein
MEEAIGDEEVLEGRPRVAGLGQPKSDAANEKCRGESAVCEFFVSEGGGEHSDCERSCEYVCVS